VTGNSATVTVRLADGRTFTQHVVAHDGRWLLTKS
jgi:hypothetical protein